MDEGQWLSQLYEEYSASLFYYAMSLLKKESDAEEVLQNLFLGLVRQKTYLRQIQQLKGYLFAGVRKEAFKLLRSQNRYTQKLEELTQLSGLVPQENSSYGEEEANQLEQILQEIPEEQREVVVLKHFSQLTFQEIANVLEISQDTAASRYRYGLQKISQKWDKILQD